MTFGEEPHDACASLGRTTGGRRRAKGLILRWFPYSNVRSDLGYRFSQPFSLSRLFLTSSPSVTLVTPQHPIRGDVSPSSRCEAACSLLWLARLSDREPDAAGRPRRTAYGQDVALLATRQRRLGSLLVEGRSEPRCGITNQLPVRIDKNSVGVRVLR